MGSGLAGGAERGPPGSGDVVKGSNGAEGVSLERGCRGGLQGVPGCRGRGWVTDLRAGGRGSGRRRRQDLAGGAACPHHGRGELRGQMPAPTSPVSPAQAWAGRSDPWSPLGPCLRLQGRGARCSHVLPPAAQGPGGSGAARGRPACGMDPREPCPCSPSAPQPHGEQPLRLVGRAEPGQLPAERGL